MPFVTICKSLKSFRLIFFVLLLSVIFRFDIWIVKFCHRTISFSVTNNKNRYVCYELENVFTFSVFSGCTVFFLLSILHFGVCYNCIKTDKKLRCFSFHCRVCNNYITRCHGILLNVLTTLPLRSIRTKQARLKEK